MLIESAGLNTAVPLLKFSLSVTESKMKRIVGTYTPEGLSDYFNYTRDTGIYSIPANTAILVPFVLSRNATVRQAIVMPARTTTPDSTSKFDVGVYTEAGKLLGSLGATLKLNVGYSCQIVSFDTPFSLFANTPYYLAFSVNNSESMFEMIPWNTVQKNGALGIRVAKDAFPLPAHTYYLDMATNQNIPLVGLNTGLYILTN